MPGRNNRVATVNSDALSVPLGTDQLHTLRLCNVPSLCKEPSLTIIAFGDILG